MPLRNSVLLSPSVPASMRPNLYPSLLLPRNVWMYPRKSVHAQEPTQGRSRSQSSRNGATFHLRSLDLLKIEECCKTCHLTLPPVPNLKEIILIWLKTACPALQ